MYSLKSVHNVYRFAVAWLMGLSSLLFSSHLMSSEQNHRWQKLVGEGVSQCSDGSPYRYLVRKADPVKVLFYLQGGGGCWSRETCDSSMLGTYYSTTENLGVPTQGIFELDNPENPFKDYSMVFASYCTGDVHLGYKISSYPPVQDGQQDLTISHVGLANVREALGWTFTNLPNAQNIFVTGSSAGSIPTPYVATLMANHYPSAKVAQLGDAAGGYRRGRPNHNPRDEWGAFPALNEAPGFEHLDPNEFTYERFYIAAAKANPDILFTEFDNAQDHAQKRFLQLRDAPTTNLLEALTLNYQDIRSEVDNFRGYIAPGGDHTIMHKPEFYTLTSDGVAFIDWVRALANFEDVPDVHCDECRKEQ
jgi:hypothetical protein